MPNQQDETIKRFFEKLKRPKREKSEQSNQQTPSSLDRARQASLDTMAEKRRQWLENQKGKEDAKSQGQ